MPTCKDCRWWNGRFRDGTMMTNASCLMSPSYGTKRSDVPSDSAFVLLAEPAKDPYPLIVGPDFGCVQFQAKDSDDA